MVYFAQDVATGQYVMPYTVTVDIMTQLTAQVNTKISTLQITGNLVGNQFIQIVVQNTHQMGIKCKLFFEQGQKYVTVNVSASETYRLELGALVCSDGFVPMHLEEELLNGVQGGFDAHDQGTEDLITFWADFPIGLFVSAVS